MSVFSLDERTVDWGMAIGLWFCHMLSLLIWMTTFVWAWQKQRRMKAAGALKSSKVMLPTQCEAYSNILMIAYGISDFIRGIDACYDGSDGVCRAVWGIMPVGGRFLFWALRDMVMLWNINEMHCFYVGWTHKVLGWPEGRARQRHLKTALVFACLGLIWCFTALAGSNRQSWQAIAVVFVVVLNAFWSFSTRAMLGKVVPALEALMRNPNVPNVAREERDSTMLAAAAGDERTSPKSNGRSHDYHAPPWVHAAISEARMSSRLLYTANVAILCVFPAIAIERIVFKNAHELELIPGVGLGGWIAHRTFPLVGEKPVGITLNPSLELIEIMIGWLLCIYTLRRSRTDDSLRAPHGPPGSAPPKCGYITDDALAEAVLAELRPASKKAQ